MQAKLVSCEGSKAVFEMTFTSLEFQRKIVESFRSLNPGDCAKPELMVLSLSSVLERTENRMEVVRGAIQALMNEHCRNAMDELGIVSIAEVSLQPVSSEIDEPLKIMATTRIAPDFGELSVEGLKVSYDRITPDGSEIDAHVANMCDSYGVETPEELCKKTGAYESVEEMRSAMARSLEKGIEQLNDKTREEALVKVLLAANPIDVPDADIEHFVEGELSKLRVQMNAQPGGTMTFDEDAMRRIIRRDEGHIPHLNIVLDIVANAYNFDITDVDRADEIAYHRGQSINPEALESVEETMAALHENAQALASLDRQVARRKALSYISDKAEFTVRAERNVREAAPQLLRKQDSVS